MQNIKQEILNQEQENNRLGEECKAHVETINKMQNDMQKMLDNRKKIDDLQMMLTNFIQKEKLGKKARRKLDALRRRTWAVCPATKTFESKKYYNRNAYHFNRQ